MVFRLNLLDSGFGSWREYKKQSLTGEGAIVLAEVPQIHAHRYRLRWPVGEPLQLRPQNQMRLRAHLREPGVGPRFYNEHLLFRRLQQRLQRNHHFVII